MQYKVLSTKFRPTDAISYNLPFMLATELVCKATCELNISTSKLELVQYRQWRLEGDRNCKYSECV